MHRTEVLQPKVALNRFRSLCTTVSLHVEESCNSVDHVEALGDGELLEGVAIRGGDISTGHSQDGTVQIVKSLA